MTCRTLASLFVLALLIGAPACGGGDDDGGASDAGSDTDGGGGGGDPDALPPMCDNLLTMFGDLGSVTGTAVSAPIDDEEPAGAQYLTAQIPLNTDTEPDVLFIELWDENTPFMDGLATGTYGLVGLQADLFSCGACVYIAANVDGGPLDFHMALGGSLTLDSVDATPGTGRIVGSLTDVGFREVTVDVNGQHVVEGGCETEISAVSFDLTVEQAQ